MGYWDSTHILAIKSILYNLNYLLGPVRLQPAHLDLVIGCWNRRIVSLSWSGRKLDLILRYCRLLTNHKFFNVSISSTRVVHARFVMELGMLKETVIWSNFFNMSLVSNLGQTVLIKKKQCWKRNIKVKSMGFVVISILIKGRKKKSLLGIAVD